MILPDVNVLVYAHREDAVDHARYRQWLEEAIQSGQPYAISDPCVERFPARRYPSASFHDSQPDSPGAGFRASGSRAG